PGVHIGPDASEHASSLSIIAGTSGSEAPPDETTGPGQTRAGLRERAGREVRHVAVVTMCIHGLAELTAASSPGQAAHALDRLKSTLEEIAFRRGAHFAWSEAKEGDLPFARAVVGLM